MRNDFRGTGLERTLASDAWHPLVTSQWDRETRFKLEKETDNFWKR